MCGGGPANPAGNVQPTDRDALALAEYPRRVAAAGNRPYLAGASTP
jgi:hypothetical protein